MDTCTHTHTHTHTHIHTYIPGFPRSRTAEYVRYVPVSHDLHSQFCGLEHISLFFSAFIEIRLSLNTFKHLHYVKIWPLCSPCPFCLSSVLTVKKHHFFFHQIFLDTFLHSLRSRFNSHILQGLRTWHTYFFSIQDTGNLM